MCADGYDIALPMPETAKSAQHFRSKLAFASGDAHMNPFPSGSPVKSGNIVRYGGVRASLGQGANQLSYLENCQGGVLLRASANLTVNNHDVMEDTKQFIVATVSGLDVMVRVCVVKFIPIRFFEVVEHFAVVQALPNVVNVLTVMTTTYGEAMRSFVAQIKREDRAEARLATKTMRRHTLKRGPVIKEPLASPPKLSVVPLGRMFTTPVSEGEEKLVLKPFLSQAMVTPVVGHTVQPPPPPGQIGQPPTRHVRMLSRAVTVGSEGHLDIHSATTTPRVLVPLTGTQSGPPPRRGTEEAPVKEPFLQSSLSVGGFASTIGVGLAPPPVLLIPETGGIGDKDKDGNKVPASTRVWVKPSSQMFSRTLSHLNAAHRALVKHSGNYSRCTSQTCPFLCRQWPSCQSLVCACVQRKAPLCCRTSQIHPVQ